jgi:hypothetical protein
MSEAHFTCPCGNRRMNPNARVFGIAGGIEVSSYKAGRSVYRQLLANLFVDVGMDIVKWSNMLTAAVEIFLKFVPEPCRVSMRAFGPREIRGDDADVHVAYTKVNACDCRTAGGIAER